MPEENALDTLSYGEREALEMALRRKFEIMIPLPPQLKAARSKEMVKEILETPHLANQILNILIRHKPGERREKALTAYSVKYNNQLTLPLEDRMRRNLTPAQKKRVERGLNLAKKTILDIMTSKLGPDNIPREVARRYANDPIHVSSIMSLRKMPRGQGPKQIYKYLRLTAKRYLKQYPRARLKPKTPKKRIRPRLPR